MKSFVCATLAAFAVASKKKFPRDDAFHADCHVSAVFTKTCDEVYTAMDSEIRAWNSATTSPAAGIYSVKEQADKDYIWSTRQTKNKKYTDD